jgi:hypothetical protein
VSTLFKWQQEAFLLQLLELAGVQAGLAAERVSIKQLSGAAGAEDLLDEFEKGS